MLRPAMEAAVAVARAGEEASPLVPAPVALRPFLQFAKLPRPALLAARRALDADADFRVRVAEDVSETYVGRAGWLFLTRPEGWEEELASMTREAAEARGEATERRAVTAARRRQAAAEAAARKAEEVALQARAEAAKATAALADARQSRRAAAREVTQLTRRLSDMVGELEATRRELLAATGEAEAAKARVAQLEAELRPGPERPDQSGKRGPERPDQSGRRGPERPDQSGRRGPEAIGRAPAPPLVPERKPEPEPEPRPVPASEPVGAVLPPEVAQALASAAQAAGKLAESLASASAAVEPGDTGPFGAAFGEDNSLPPAPTVPPGATRPADRRRVPPAARFPSPRRSPAPLPPAVWEDSPEAAEHLLRLPSVILLVDGYNVSNAGWPGRPISEQRRRLIDSLTRLVARTGADVRVIFDGGDLEEFPSVPTAARPVHVSFSPPGVEADDVILHQIGELPRGRPVVVATSDRRVQQEAARRGANVIFSSQLLTVLR